MKHVLVTGATGFLGYHVTKRLNELGIRPRVLELPGSDLERLGRLEIERCRGDLGDPGILDAACAGVDTLLHTAFKVGTGSHASLLDEMRRINIDGTGRLLDAAAARGISRVVVTGSALAVGVNRQPQPLDEDADWSRHAFTFPYAMIRRDAEQAALRRSQPGFIVSSVAPSFTLGPEDPTGAPANALVKRLIDGKLPFTIPVSFGCLDVRDFATGMVLAGERAASGRRYLLNGENVTATQFAAQVAAVAGVKPPRLGLPPWLLHIAVAGLGMVSALRRRPAPVTKDVLQILNRHAWYDTTRARTELGWAPRPLVETLQDTVRWLRQQER
jgi:dihydroflavonol-4-reductase